MGARPYQVAPRTCALRGGLFYVPYQIYSPKNSVNVAALPQRRSLGARHCRARGPRSGAMRAIKTIAAAVAVLFAVGHAASQVQHLPVAQAMVRATLDPIEGVTDQQTRNRLARAAFEYCRAADKIVPRNTPPEDDWVAIEMKSKDVDRIMRLTGSIEFSRWALLRALKDCMLTSALIAFSTPPQTTKEAKLWAELAITFSNADDLRRHAFRLGLGNERQDPYGFQYLSGLRLALMRTVAGTIDEAN
jgi:hypothetical protein